MDHLPEQVREQLRAQKEQCIFCRIIGGEVPSKKVYEDELLTMVLDINPAVKGHVLLMTKEHYPVLPLLSKQEFERFFGLLPQFSNAIVKAALAERLTVFMANGGAAGQQAPHFLAHLLPRERNDRLSQFVFEKRSVNQERSQAVDSKVRQVLAAMLRKHIGFEPIASESLLASRDIVISRSPVEQAAGHLEITFTDRARLGELSYERSARLFTAASLAATALFENIGCQGTNIIALDEKELVIHVIPRDPEDGLGLLWEPMREAPDLDKIAGSLTDALFDVKVRVEKGQLDPPSATPRAPKVSDRERIDRAFASLRD